MSWLERSWYRTHPVRFLLAPLALLFCGLALLRRVAFRRGWRRVERLPVPVVVVGNISVGGTGKTPLVLHLVEVLRNAGWRPGIVSRGYGGSVEAPRPVQPDSDPLAVGDEPLLLARRADCPVWIGRDRPAAARALLAANPCDVIVCDDGLQHYRLGRDVEVAVVDAARGLGNGWCLPAGPLREPPARLRSVDLLVATGGAFRDAVSMQLRGDRAEPVAGREGARALSAFAGEPLAAVAGIGRPERFFEHLRRAGLAVEAHPFADHHRYTADDFAGFGERTVLMTEKDAVKCGAFAGANLWFVPVRAELPRQFDQRIIRLLSEVRDGQKAA